MADSKVLEVLEDVEFRYPGDEAVSYVVPAGLVLRSGETWWIRGESGWGKSTLMTLLAALRRFDQGRIAYCLDSAGPPVEVSPESWRTQVGPELWGRIGFAFQRPELLRALNVGDNLGLVGGSTTGVPLFDNEEWEPIAASPVWKISGGQVQRLGLLRAFAAGQDLVFLDEPTNNLDRRNRDEVARFVQEQRQGRGLVLVSHDDAFVDRLSVDRVFDVDQRPAGADHLVRRLTETLPPQPVLQSVEGVASTPA